MAEAITIARPYANAVFNIANDKVELKAWSELLAVFAQFVEDGEIAQMIASPSVTDRKSVV